MGVRGRVIGTREHVMGTRGGDVGWGHKVGTQDGDARTCARDTESDIKKLGKVSAGRMLM